MKKVDVGASPRPLIFKRGHKNPGLDERFYKGPPHQQNTVTASQISAGSYQMRPLMSLRTPQYSSHCIASNSPNTSFQMPSIPSLLEKTFGMQRIPKPHHQKKGYAQNQDFGSFSQNLTIIHKHPTLAPWKTGNRKANLSVTNTPAGIRKGKVGQEETANNNICNRNEKTKAVDPIPELDKTLQSAYAEHLKKLKRKSSSTLEKCSQKHGEKNLHASPKKLKLENRETTKKSPVKWTADKTKPKSINDVKYLKQEAQSIPVKTLTTEKTTHSKPQVTSRCTSKIINRSHPCTDKTKLEIVQGKSVKSRQAMSSSQTKQGFDQIQNSPSLSPVKMASVSPGQNSLTKGNPYLQIAGTLMRKQNIQSEQQNSAYLEHLKKLKPTKKPVALNAGEKTMEVEEKNLKATNDQIAFDSHGNKSEKVGQAGKMKRKICGTATNKNMLTPNEKSIASEESKNQQNAADSSEKQTKNDDKKELAIAAVNLPTTTTGVVEKKQLVASKKPQAATMLKTEKSECQILLKGNARPISSVIMTDRNLGKKETSPRISVQNAKNRITCVVNHKSPYGVDTDKISLLNTLYSGNHVKVEKDGTRLPEISRCTNARDLSINTDDACESNLVIKRKVDSPMTRQCRGHNDHSASMNDRFDSKIRVETNRTNYSVKDKLTSATHPSTSVHNIFGGKIRQSSNFSVSMKNKQASTEEVMKFPKDEFVIIDSMFTDDKRGNKSAVKLHDTKKMVASDFFSDSDAAKCFSKTNTVPVKGILKKPSNNNVKSYTKQLPDKENTDATSRESHPKIRPDLPVDNDVITVIPSRQRDREDLHANMSIDTAIAAGLEFLHPVSGYHCVLCQTFYHDYPTALHHCTQLSHKMKVVKEMGTKNSTGSKLHPCMSAIAKNKV